jgi:hypothetical protein
MPNLSKSTTLFHSKENNLVGFGEKAISIRRSIDDSLVVYLNNKGQMYLPKPIGILECSIVIDYIKVNDLVEKLKNW